MNTEQLMKPRYKVIGIYPEIEKHAIKVGDILTDNGRFETTRNQDGDARWTFEWSLFPNIFKSLAWWEDRDEKDMPEYVWYNFDLFDPKAGNSKVLKVKKWVTEPDGEMWAEVSGDETGYSIYYMQKPATQSEYDNQQPPLK